MGAAERAGRRPAHPPPLQSPQGSLRNLQLGELLLDNPPPGTDEAIALTAVLKLLEDFTRVVLDTAPTGHTLRLLTLPDFLDAALGKVAALRRLIASAGSAVSALLGGASGADKQVAKVEELRKDMLANLDQAAGDAVAEAAMCQQLIPAVEAMLGERLLGGEADASGASGG